MQPVVIIPAYQPGPALIDLVKDLSQHQLIIVNDGSSNVCDEIFKTLQTMSNVEVLHHATNLGKGQALKTAFNHYLLNYADDHMGVVTADADGQHLVKDIQKISRSLQFSPHILWLGARQFRADIPLRSRFGNTLTRKVFKLLVGPSIGDTQTGLRAIPRGFVKEILHIHFSGYEFELDMLIQATQKKLEIQEVPIETVYIDGNKSSHFNPLLDSLKIYFVFLRFSALSVASGCIDFIMFALSYMLTSNILTSTVMARVLSGSFNFIFCKKLIFKSSGKILHEIIKYLLLALAAIFLSYVLVITLVNVLGLNVYVSKLIADLCIFLTNFVMQRSFVFRSRVSVETPSE